MQSTTAVPEERVAPPRVDFAFHGPHAVGIATFLGSPLAGGTLLALNFAHLGRRGAAALTMLGALVATSLLVASGFVIDFPGLNTGITLGLCFGMIQMARSLQGEALSAHLVAGGREASRWAGAGVGLAFCVVLLGGIFGWAFLYPELGTAVTVSATSTVYVQGQASEAEARTLGALFEEMQVFGAQEADAVLIDEPPAEREIWLFLGAPPSTEDRVFWRGVAESAHARLPQPQRPLALSLRNPEHEELARFFVPPAER